MLGAVGAFIFSLLVPPRYEAAAAVAVSVDYTRTEPLELVVEDRALDRVWQLAVSDESIQQAAQQLGAKLGPGEAWASGESLRAHTRLDARLSRWEFIGIHRDPSLSAEIANAWMDTVVERLDEAYDHAWEAALLQGAVFDVTCLGSQDGNPEASLWECVAVGPEITPDQVQRLREEIEASHGILPIFSYEIVEWATPPTKAVLWPRGLLLLAGTMSGFLIGVLLTIAKAGLPHTPRDPSSKSQELA
jgi:uncharacterized protein involved in exopolysaccharide biosynthesis